MNLLQSVRRKREKNVWSVQVFEQQIRMRTEKMVLRKRG